MTHERSRVSSEIPSTGVGAGASTEPSLSPVMGRAKEKRVKFGEVIKLLGSAGRALKYDLSVFSFHRWEMERGPEEGQELSKSTQRACGFNPGCVYLQDEHSSHTCSQLGTVLFPSPPSLNTGSDCAREPGT